MNENLCQNETCFSIELDFVTFATILLIDTKDEESDNEDNSQEDDDEAIKPKRNAFDLLDDDDED